MTDETQGTQDNEQPKGRDLMESVERESMRSDVPEFHVGDTVDVAVTIREGEKERVQVFTGTCIARKGSGTRESFTVRRVVQGQGVERVFPLHSPRIADITVRRRGKVRRAKLYYLRGRTGRAARIKELLDTKPKAKSKN